MKAYCVLVMLMLLTSLGLRAQSNPERLDVVVLLGEDLLPVPEVSGEAMYLLAHPLRPEHLTTVPKRFRYPWDVVDYSERRYRKIGTDSVYRESFFYYEPSLGVSYDFYYKDEGEVVSAEQYASLRFVKMPGAIKRLAKYEFKDRGELFGRISGPNTVTHWQHPNLWIVYYNKEKKTYYKHRVIWTTYLDSKHPDAVVWH